MTLALVTTTPPLPDPAAEASGHIIKCIDYAVSGLGARDRKECFDRIADHARSRLHSMRLAAAEPPAETIAPVA